MRQSSVTVRAFCSPGRFAFRRKGSVWLTFLRPIYCGIPRPCFDILRKTDLKAVLRRLLFDGVLRLGFSLLSASACCLPVGRAGYTEVSERHHLSSGIGTPLHPFVQAPRARIARPVSAIIWVLQLPLTRLGACVCITPFADHSDILRAMVEICADAFILWPSALRQSTPPDRPHCRVSRRSRAAVYASVPMQLPADGNSQRSCSRKNWFLSTQQQRYEMPEEQGQARMRATTSLHFEPAEADSYPKSYPQRRFHNFRPDMWLAKAEPVLSAIIVPRKAMIARAISRPVPDCG